MIWRKYYRPYLEWAGQDMGAMNQATRIWEDSAGMAPAKTARQVAMTIAFRDYKSKTGSRLS